MSDKTFTHKDLAALLGVSETTVKSYRRKFPGCIPVANQGKPIRFTAEAANVAGRIRDLFETGMSVNEVRGRLAREFAWISPDKPAARETGHPDACANRPAGAAALEVGPEISAGVSNMAKSMVAMTQQQKALLARMEGIESLLEDLGLKGIDNLEDIRSKSLAAARAREEKLEMRLNRLDEATQELADTVHGLAEGLGRFLGRREEAAQQWQQESEAVRAAAARITAETSGSDDSALAEKGSAGAAVFRLRHGPNGLEAERASPPGASPGAEFAEGSTPEPARHFFTLPLVVRTAEGRYISAGGRGRGRFSVNDLKAMLIHGFMPPNHFILRWEPHGQGWWLFLEQEKTGKSVNLLLMELPTQKSGNVAEILKLVNNDDNVHPAEFYAIMESLGE